MLLILLSVYALLLIMQKQGFLYENCLGKISSRRSTLFFNLFLDTSIIKNSCHLKASSIKGQNEITRFINKETYPKILVSNYIKSTLNENVEELYGGGGGDDDELCPVECVREFKTDEELSRIMDKAKESNALVVVDFYRTSCGSCKYIEQGFQKLCKGSGNEDSPVIFLKHNVLDEYDERSEVAERLRIRSVPLFYFYKNGLLLEAFPTRDKVRILDAISKYTTSSSSSSERVDSLK